MKDQLFSATLNMFFLNDSYVHNYIQSIDLLTLIELIDFILCDGTRLTVTKEIGRDYHGFGVLLLNDVTGAWISATEQTHKGR